MQGICPDPSGLSLAGKSCFGMLTTFIKDELMTKQYLIKFLTGGFASVVGGVAYSAE
jgi:hypothetical protein